MSSAYGRIHMKIYFELQTPDAALTSLVHEIPALFSGGMMHTGLLYGISGKAVNYPSQSFYVHASNSSDEGLLQYSDSCHESGQHGISGKFSHQIFQ
jgi:hypothetical protein